MDPEAFTFLRQLAKIHSRKLPTELVGQLWTAASFVESSCSASRAPSINMAAAHEIGNQITIGPRLARPPRGGSRHHSLVRA